MVKPRRHVSRKVSPLVREAVDAIVRRVDGRTSLIVLFGSEAGGEATPESDIDLLVVLEESKRDVVREVLDAVYDVMWQHDFGRIISVVTMSKTDFDKQRRKGFSFVRNVERDGITLREAA